MDIRATTTYDYEVTRDYVRYTMFRRKKSNRIKWHLLAAILLALVMGTYAAFTPEVFEFSLILFFFVAFIIVIYVYMYFWQPKRAFKETSALQMGVASFTFSDETFSISTNGTLINSIDNVNYTALYKVCETPKYFYLFIRSNQAFIVKKSGIIDGSQEQLRAILTNCIPKNKYFKSK